MNLKPLPECSHAPATPDFSLHPEADRSFLAAQAFARDLLKKGDAIAFSVVRCRERGRLIHIETKQGWDPDPLFEEFPDDCEPSPPN